MLVAILTGCLLLVMATSPALAQSCEERAEMHPGGWIRGDDAGGGGSAATARNKAQIAALLDRIATIVRQAIPEPLGSQGKLYRNYGLASFAGAEDATYELVANFKGYGCDRRTELEGAIVQYGETATWLYVQVNSFWSATQFETPQFFLSPDHEGVLTLVPRQVLRTPQPGYPGRKKLGPTLPERFAAYPSFTFEQEYDSTDYSYNRREVLQVVFLTPDGGLPYAPLSIGEFLDVNESRLRRYIEQNREYGPVDHHQTLLERVPRLRQQLAPRLSQPAYIRAASWSEDWLTEANPFVDAATGYALVRRSSNLLGGSGSWQPRFIALSWRWQPEAPYSVRVHEAIGRGLDLEALRSLLAG